MSNSLILRFLLAVILAALVGPSTACSMYSYERGTVKRVEVKKDVSAAAIDVRAAFASREAGAAWTARRASRGFQAGLAASVAGKVVPASGGAGAQAPSPGASAASPGAAGRAIRLDMQRRGQVDLARTRIYNTIEWEANSTWARPLWEVLEFATSPLYMLILPPLVIAGIGFPDDENYQTGGLTKLKVATAPLNPCICIFGTNLDRTANIDEVRFRDPPLALSYATRFPLSDARFRYRLLAADGRELAKGEARTDVFGEAYIEAPPEGVKKIEVKGEGLDATVGL